KEEQRLIEEFKDWNKKIWLYANSFRMMDVIVGSISVIGIFFVLYVVLQKLMAGEVSIGDVVLVAGFSTSFFYRFFELLWHVRGIAKHHADLDKYFAVLDNEVLIKDPAQPVAVKEIKGQVEMQDVSFKYPDSQDYVLQNIDLKIPAGSSVAFVGRSGAGKTTIVKLLLRFYDVSAGKIAIDGIDIKDFAKSQLRSFIGIVPQEPILFNNTIGYNIAYGKDDATKEDIVQAAKLANLHDFIDSLPLGYDTEVGERGIKLSGGQKQRLAIARMILADPSIIVFDEATSNLDSESERLIQDALEKVSKGRTVLIIAHRFSTVRRVDKIVVMEQGKVIETGNHDSLIRKRDGLYSYLWRLQTKQAKVSSEVSLLE
ncbi:MAG: ABC transporter ATP-binding protein, partial [Patescibacteria group bacterium]